VARPLDIIRMKFQEEVLGAVDSRPEGPLVVRKNRIHEILAFLKNNPELDMNFLMDIAGVDFLGEDPRFEVVYNLYSLSKNHRLLLRVKVPESDLHLPTATHLWHSADWGERECWDQYGIVFDGHPFLRRILNHEDFVGHPLRKDYAVEGRQPLKETVDYQILGNMVPETDGAGLDGGIGNFIELNLGPAHTATHGTLRSKVLLDGEIIVKVVPEIGYLHRGFEIMSEQVPYQHVIPYTDRLNYCSAPMNNTCYAMAVEKMLGIEAPPRAQRIRVIIDEIGRIIDHLVALGVNAMDMGAFTNFWYAFWPRELAYDIFSKLCGSRLTTTYTRIGGMPRDLYDGFESDVKGFIKALRAAISDIMALLKKNRIFNDRVREVGMISKELAISYGFTGPNLRAAGVEYDVRKAQPYNGYDQFDFDIPLGEKGDTWDRFFVRVEEIHQSCKIIDQALKDIPGGPFMTEDYGVALPPKKDVYGSIEGLMAHFKHIMHGIRPPKGEAYFCTEAANGELGFYIVSDGGPKAYRNKCRPPCFYYYSAFPYLAEGSFLADAVVVLGSMNVIAGELDR
jgi:NADH-quinone oxidoreductase subunit C/D